MSVLASASDLSLLRRFGAEASHAVEPAQRRAHGSGEALAQSRPAAAELGRALVPAPEARSARWAPGRHAPDDRVGPGQMRVLKLDLADDPLASQASAGSAALPLEVQSGWRVPSRPGRAPDQPSSDRRSDGGDDQIGDRCDYRD
jgi:hypothetical protein